MNRYLTHLSALSSWNFPLAKEYFSEEIKSVGMSQRLVLTPKHRKTIDNTRDRLCTTKLPKGSLLIRNNVGIVSPQMMFVQLANEFEIHKTIILGNLICARDQGPSNEQRLFKKQLLKYAIEARGLPGRRKALQALKYIKDGSCSIMENFTDLIIGLPNFLGGIGIEGGVFNEKIHLNEEGRKMTDKEYCFVDYIFHAEKIGYEYQGSYHNGNQDKDLSRKFALEGMGYDIIFITKSMFYNEYKLDQFCKKVARRHGKNFRIRTKQYEINRNIIHSLLPRNSKSKTKSLYLA